MTPQIQTGNVVEPLEGMPNHERESRNARPRLQLGARIRRFVEEFRTNAASFRICARSGALFPSAKLARRHALATKRSQERP